MFFFFKQKTAYELRISDWSSDVSSSDLAPDESAMSRSMVRSRRHRRRSLRLAGIGIGNAEPGQDRRLQGLHLRCLGGLLVVVAEQIGRASCRERVFQYWSISVVAESLKKK